jgi:hypothetical protein
MWILIIEIRIHARIIKEFWIGSEEKMRSSHHVARLI